MKKGPRRNVWLFPARQSGIGLNGQEAVPRRFVPSLYSQTTGSSSPHRNASNEPVSLSMSRTGEKNNKKNRTCQPGRDEHETRGAFRLAPGSRTNQPRPLSSALIWQSTLMPPNSARVMTERQLHIGLYQTSPTFLTTFFASPSEIREGVITDGIRDVLWREKQKKPKRKNFTF